MAHFKCDLEIFFCRNKTKKNQINFNIIIHKYTLKWVYLIKCDILLKIYDEIRV